MDYFNSTKGEDYKNTHFDHPELSRIVGEPSLASLITLRNQIKANAQTVDSTLGGGAHGHLGLVLTPQVYATIPSTTPYLRPRLPQLDIQPTDTQYQIAQKRHQYAEDLRQFREVQGVERCLVQQIVAAIEPKYLRALRDVHTHKINKTVPEILRYLFNTYGDVSPLELKQLRDQVEAMVFDPTEPVNTIFVEIDDLDTIAEMAENPFNESQKIDMAYLILQNCKRFTSGLKKWDKKDYAEKTWENFTDMFRKEQRNLRRTGELTVADTLNKDDFINMLSEGIKDGVELALASKEETSTESRDDIAERESDDKDELFKQLEQMNATIQKLQQEKENNNNYFNPMMNGYMNQMYPNMMMGTPFQHPNNFNGAFFNNQQQRRNNNRNNQRRGGRKRNPGRRFDFYNRYCWSCGGCDHWGRNCTSKKTGHQDSATFRNKLGGSVDNCFSS